MMWLMRCHITKLNVTSQLLDIYRNRLSLQMLNAERKITNQHKREDAI